MVHELGARRGAEELTLQLNPVFDALIMDVLVGSTLERLAADEAQAREGEIVVGPETVIRLDDVVVTHPVSDTRYGKRVKVIWCCWSPVCPHTQWRS